MPRTADRFVVSPAAYLVPAIALLVLPIQWVVAWVFAVLIHESGHVMAVLLTGGRIRSVKIGWNAMTIEADICKKWQEAVCALAGPVFSFLTLFMAEIFPRLAICCVVQGAYNLLPVYPMDGGRILQVVLSVFLSETACEKVQRWIRIILYSVLGSLCLHIAVRFSLGLVPGICALFLLFKRGKIKFPCKQARNKLQ